MTSGVGFGGEVFDVPQVLLLEILKGLISPAKTFPPCGFLGEWGTISAALRVFSDKSTGTTRGYRRAGREYLINAASLPGSSAS